MKRNLLFKGILILISFFLVMPTLCFAQAKKEPKVYKWRMNQGHPADSPFGRAAEAFADEVRKKTNGRIDIKVYHAGALGDWVLSNELVMRGDVEMDLNPIAPTYDVLHS